MLVNTREFTRTAQNFIKTGAYTQIPRGTPEYRKFWQEEERRCLEGYSIGGTRVTGDHYFYLNYTQIRLTEDDNARETVSAKRSARKVVTFPDFWDGDYDYYHQIERAKREGKHLCVLKSRRKGFSYKNASMAIKDYFFHRKSLTMLCAYEQKYLIGSGIVTKAWDFMDFVDQHTAWSKRRHEINKTLHRRASFKEKLEDGTDIIRGFKSEIIGLTFKDNPDAARGKDANLILFEEAGTFNNLLDAYERTRPCVEDGIYTTGLIIVFGTGGSEEADFLGLEKMFWEPDAFNMLSFENIWDENMIGTRCSYFVPDYMNKPGFMDEHGNSLQAEAKAYEEEERRKLRIASSNPAQVAKYIAERCWTPTEAMLRIGNQIFPTADIEMWRKQLMSGKVRDPGVAGKLVREASGIKFMPDNKLKPIVKYPHDTKDSLEGAVVLYEAPYRVSGKVPANLYKIVYDPVGQDESGSSFPSLGAAYVYKQINTFSQPDDIIVASWVSRMPTQDDYNRVLFMLAEYYNAKIGFENNRGNTVEYAKRMKLLPYLDETPDILNASDGRRTALSYGTAMNSLQRKMQGEKYFSDWLITSRGVDEEGEEKLNLHTIYDVALLDELLRYNRVLNADRVSAWVCGMFHIKSSYNKRVEQLADEDTSSFFNRQFFS